MCCFFPFVGWILNSRTTQFCWSSIIRFQKWWKLKWEWERARDEKKTISIYSNSKCMVNEIRACGCATKCVRIKNHHRNENEPKRDNQGQRTESASENKRKWKGIKATAKRWKWSSSSWELNATKFSNETKWKYKNKNASKEWNGWRANEVNTRKTTRAFIAMSGKMWSARALC